MTEAFAIKIIGRATLTSLPSASEAVFPGLFPWTPLSTTTLTKFLNVDRGNFGTWRNRGLTPEPLPSGWFKRASGNPIVYRLDAVRDWLARRSGERYDALDDWRNCVLTEFGHPPSAVACAATVRQLAALYGRAAGPRVGDVNFTAAGFEDYVASLAPSRG